MMGLLGFVTGFFTGACGIGLGWDFDQTALSDSRIMTN